jgi:hypothetical protein
MFGSDFRFKSRYSISRLFRLNSRSASLAFALIVLFGLFPATAQCQQPTQRVVLRNPTVGQINAQPGNVAGHAYGSIQDAINVPSSGAVYIYLPCGTYVENVVIATSDVRIEGAERGCVQLEPADPTLPVVSIDSTNAGQIGIGYDEVSDLTITCPSGSTCADGLKITGRTDIYQPNDWHKFSRIGVYGAFQNGIDIAGRTIWTEFDNVEVELARGNGINIASSGTTNELTFRAVRSAANYNYGIYINNTQKDLANGILFDKVNAEYNGNNPSLPNCAGIYLTGVSQASITNSYFEGNCPANTADKTSAEIRLTGTYNQSVNIENSVFNMQYTEGGIYNDTLQTTGTYSGNKFTGSGVNGLPMYIATAHPISGIVVGINFSASPTIVPDVNGKTHVFTLAPLGFDYSATTSVQNNTVNVGGTNTVILYYGPYTINNFVNGNIGQLLYVMALTNGGHILTNSAGGAGQIVFADGQNRTLNLGESLLLYYDGASWRPIERSVSAQVTFVGTITTTASLSDSLSVAGLSPQAHCSYAATNDLAGTMRSTYITVYSGSLTLNHLPIVGATFDVFCTTN